MLVFESNQDDHGPERDREARERCVVTPDPHRDAAEDDDKEDPCCGVLVLWF